MKKYKDGQLVNLTEDEMVDIQSGRSSVEGSGIIFSHARQIGYGPIGEQLDLLYKELDLLYTQLAAAGLDLNPGPFFTHIQQVKAGVPKI